MLVRKLSSGRSTMRRTPTAAARWKTRSAPSMSRRTSSASSTEPVWYSSRGVIGDRPEVVGSPGALVVEHDDVIAQVEEEFDEVTADEPGSAGDHAAHPDHLTA